MAKENKMKYEVNFHDYETGATSPIDNIEAPEGYTARQYIKDCKANADDEWNQMLKNGEVRLSVYEEAPTIREIIQSTGMTQTAFAKRFCIPLRTVQDWHRGERKCAEYIRKMMVEILNK